MSFLSAENLKTLRDCAKDEAAYQRLVDLFHQREQEFSDQIDDLDTQVVDTLAVIEEFILLNNVSWLLINAQDLEQLLSAFVNPLLQSESCGALLLFAYLDKAGNPREVEVMASLSSDERLQLPKAGFRYTGDAVLRLTNLPDETMGIVSVGDYETVPDSYLEKSLLLGMNIRATTVIPMYLPENNLLAMVTLTWSYPRPFREDEVRFYELLSGQMATRIENYRLVQRLEAKTEETSRLLANLPIGVLLLDEYGNIVQVNQTLRHITGFQDEELLQMRAADLLESNNLSVLDEKLSFTEQYVFEDQFARHDGTRFPVAVRISEVPGADGDFGGWLASVEDITQRKRSQEQLQEYAARLHALFDSSPQAVFLLDPEYSVLAYNSVARDQVWKEAGKHIQLGKSVLDYTEGFDSQEFQQDFIRCLKGNEVHRELQIELPDGRIKWFEFNFLPIRTEENTIMGVAFTSLNITERKQDEEKLRASEARNQALVNGIPDQIFIYDNNNVFTDYHVSEVVRDTDSPKRFLGKTVREIAAPDLGDRLEKTFAKARKTGDVQVVEYRNTQNHYFDMRVLPYDDNHLMAIVRDVTEAKLAEQAVRESEQQLRQITENIQQVFYVIDFKTHHLLYVSPAYTTIWGQSIHEVSRDIPVYAATVHPDDQDMVLAAVRDETENQEPFNQEFRIIQPSGEVRYIWARNFLLRDDKGEAYRIVGIAEDLTERKEAEQRTLDLVLERERVHILTDFIEMASHEFRTPLSIVNTKLYLLERTKDQDQWPPHINEIRQQLADILTLIESLVTMTRLNQDVQKQVPVNVNSLVDILCRGLHLEVAAKSITLNHVLMEDGPIVLCDPEELRDAFEHIMINAIRYTPENGTVSIQEYEQNDSVVIEFRDTGIGMTPEEQAHIFESFYRADRAHTTRGFGLGLPIAQKIIERHGGRIEVESERDHGSIFRVILPQAAVLDDVTSNRREV